MMNKKIKLITMALTVALSVAMITGCSQKSTGSSETAVSQQNKEEKFILEYTESMKKQGFTEAIEFEKAPERIVCVSTSTTPLLFELGTSLVGVPKSSVYEIPSDYTGETLKSLMSDDFNIETVIALNPDLVVMPSSSKEKYEESLTAANIPVYYTNSGHSSSYESVVEEAKVIIDAFGKDSEGGKKVLESFEEIEKKMEESKKALEGKSVMILATTQYIQSKLGTAGSMADKIGLTNVYENDKAGMVPLDQETTLGYNPDVVLVIGNSMSDEENETTIKSAFAKNPEYWNSFEAIKNDKVIYLPSSYMPNTGIGVVEKISNLIDKVNEKLEIK